MMTKTVQGEVQGYSVLERTGGIEVRINGERVRLPRATFEEAANSGKLTGPFVPHALSALDRGEPAGPSGWSD